jgi:hypothetical protein
MGKPKLIGNVKWFSEKLKPKGKLGRTSPRQRLALRIRDLVILFRSRYGITLPDDDAGRDDLEIALNHLACMPYPHAAMDHWIEIWAPWLTAAEKRDMFARIMPHPMRWKADPMAWRLKVTMEERMALGLTTIGSIDCNRAGRKKRRKALSTKRKEVQRRKQGAKPRALYESESVSRTKPWLAEGISRATWYRRKTSVPDTTPATA